jgi:virginiamycin B lyase
MTFKSRSIRAGIAAVVVGVVFVMQGAEPRGSVSGVVKTADGSPAQGALVKVRSAAGLMVTVISQEKGEYHIPNLPVGKYSIRATGGGFQSESKGDIDVAAGNTSAVGLSLSTPQSFLDARSITKLASLMPEDKGKAVIVGVCTDCHQYGVYEIISQRKSRKDWVKTIEKMKTDPAGTGKNTSGDGRVLQIWDHEREQAVEYLAKHYGPKSRPLDTKAIDTTAWVKGAAAKAVITEFAVTPNASPHDVAVDSKGIGWVTEGGLGSIGRFDPKTFTYTRIMVPGSPSSTTAVEIDSKDRVWVSDGRNNRLIRYDPATKEFETYPLPRYPQPDGRVNANTIRFLRNGEVWFTGISANVIGRLNQETKEVKLIPVPAGVSAKENVNPYGMAVDGQQKIWFLERRTDKIARVDPATAELVEYDIPTKGAVLRRMATDAKGNMWFGQYGGIGKLAMIDQTNGKVTEYPTPTKYSGAYSVDIHPTGNLIWFNEMMADQIVRFDPRTKAFVEYPVPTPYSSIRRIEADPTKPDRVWFSGSHVDTVGYLDVLQ